MPAHDMRQRDGRDRPVWYAVLGVDPSATFVEIRVAYRRHALALHAERLRSAEAHDTLAGAHGRLREVSDAYRTLRHPETRRAYDLVREGQVPSVAAPAPDGRPTLHHQASRERQSAQPEIDRRRLGRIAVVLGFGLLVLWALVASIADRREAAASQVSSPSEIASPPDSEP
jgi:curved DNA-binding protein CbpA